MDWLASRQGGTRNVRLLGLHVGGYRALDFAGRHPFDSHRQRTERGSAFHSPATSWPRTFSTTRPLPYLATHTTGSCLSVFFGSIFLSENAVARIFAIREHHRVLV